MTFWLAGVPHVNMETDGSLKLVLDVRESGRAGPLVIRMVPLAAKALQLVLQTAIAEKKGA